MKFEKNLNRGVVAYLDIDGHLFVQGEKGNVLQQVHLEGVPQIPTFQPVSIKVKWNEAREMFIRLKVEYRIHSHPVLKNTPADHQWGKGKYDLAQHWRITYGDQGILLNAGLLQDLGSSYGPEKEAAIAVQLGPDQSANETDKTHVLLAVRMSGGFADDGFTVGFGAYGADFQAQMGGSKSGFSQDLVVRVNITVEGRPEKPVSIPEHVLKHIVVIEKENQRDPGATELRRISDIWIASLRKDAPELYAAIEAGEVTVMLYGYASTTASDEYNMKLSADRITYIMEAIRSNFSKGDRIDFWQQPQGKKKARQSGPVVNEHRVEILINRADAIMGVQRMRKK